MSWLRILEDFPVFFDGAADETNLERSSYVEEPGTLKRLEATSSCPDFF